MCVCMYIYLSFRTHVSKAVEAKSNLYTRNEGNIEPVLNLYRQVNLGLRRVICADLKCGWSEFVRT